VPLGRPSSAETSSPCSRTCIAVTASAVPATEVDKAERMSTEPAEDRLCLPSESDPLDRAHPTRRWSAENPGCYDRCIACGIGQKRHDYAYAAMPTARDARCA
jgi:hypothetical protein